MVKIRLRREGRRNKPCYRIVVADQRSPRDGKFIDILGNYDPTKEGENFSLDLSLAEKWLKIGAQPSQTVQSLINKARKQQ